MGPVGAEVMWQAVLHALEEAAQPGLGRPLRVLDVGGGTGGDAVRIASAGHQVAVVDPSPDALAALDRRARDAGVQITQILGDTAGLAEHVPDRSIDLVLCHDVLEHVDEPVAALQSIAATMTLDACLSVVVAGRIAGVMARALAGDFDGASALVQRSLNAWDVRRDGPRRYLPAELDALLTDAGFVPGAVRGLRVFADFVPSSVVDLEPGARDALFALEDEVRERPEFCGYSGGLQQIACLESN